MAGAGDVFRGAAEFHRQHHFRDQVAGFRPDDLSDTDVSFSEDALEARKYRLLDPARQSLVEVPRGDRRHLARMVVRVTRIVECRVSR